MKFSNVVIENFLAIGEAHFSLEDKGLIHVFGDNRTETSADSNGSGKSSLGDAIDWCIWGVTARGVSGDDVVHTPAGKGTKVSIELIDDDGTVYRIDRYRKYPKHKNALHVFKLNDDGTETDLTKGTNPLTQKLIERIMGCSQAVFDSAVYSGQEATPDIPSMTDKQLKLMVEEASGIDILANAYEDARGALREAQEKRADAQVQLDRCLDKRETAQTHLDRTKITAKEWNEQQKLRRKEAVDRAKYAIGVYNKEVAAFDKKAVDKLNNELDEVNARIDAVADEQEREAVLAADLSKVEAAQQKITLQLQQAKKDVSRLEAKVEQRKQEVGDVESNIGKPCPECDRPLEEKHLEAVSNRAADKLATAEKELTEAVEAESQLQDKLRKVKALHKKAETALERHRNSMTDVSKEHASAREIQRSIDVLKAQERELRSMKKEAEALAERAKEIATEENPHLASIDELEKDIEDLDKAIDVARDATEAAQVEENYAAAVVDVYSPAGVRAHRLDEVTPFLNERTSHYLGSLADGAIEAYWTTLTESSKGDLREKFSVHVEKQGSAPSFKSLSGGEKRKVRIACSLALQDLVATRATKSIDLFIGDEIDDALDSAGLERLMGILEEKARERGTVLVISHSDIGHFARQTMIVRKTNDVAEVIIQ